MKEKNTNHMSADALQAETVSRRMHKGSGIVAAAGEGSGWERSETDLSLKAL